MRGRSGIWIDHSEAFIVFAETMYLQHAESGIERHVRYSGESGTHGAGAEDRLDRRFAAQLAKYYDDVISHVGGAESILIFGPGEAKGELRKRLDAKGLGPRVVGCEAADRMTGHQIVAKVRHHFEHTPRQPTGTP